MRIGVITLLFGAALLWPVLGGQLPDGRSVFTGATPDRPRYAGATPDRPRYAGATPDRPIKCGWGAHPELLRARIATLQERPDRHKTYFSPDSTFAVHYDTFGVHSPDTTSTLIPGVPDWVVEVAAALDSSRNLLLNLGFDHAPADEDSVYDVYLQEYNGGTYGLTEPDGADVYGRIISYIRMDNNFSEDENYYTHGIDAARVTAAHEYFHAVQLGYGWRDADLFFYEISSTWFEDVAFPEVNDWVYWYSTFSNNPTLNITQTDGYSIAIFGHYLTHITGIYQPDIMRQTWERFKSIDATSAIGTSIAFYDGNLTTAWTDFVARLFLNGRAPDPELYFYADQDSLHAPDPGMAETLVDGLSLPFYNLLPGTAGIQALELAGRPANLCLQVQHEPQDYSGRVVIDMGGDNLILSTLTLDAWYAAGLSSLSKVIVVVGGDRDSVVVTASVADTLTNIAFSLDYLAPNPLVINRSIHRQITLGYTVGKALSQGDHRIIIYNLLGQELYRQRIERTVGEGSQTLYLSTLPFATWPAGIYILRLTLDQRHTFTRTFTLLR